MAITNRDVRRAAQAAKTTLREFVPDVNVWTSRSKGEYYVGIRAHGAIWTERRGFTSREAYAFCDALEAGAQIIDIEGNK